MDELPGEEAVQHRDVTQSGPMFPAGLHVTGVPFHQRGHEIRPCARTIQPNDPGGADCDATGQQTAQIDQYGPPVPQLDGADQPAAGGRDHDHRLEPDTRPPTQALDQAPPCDAAQRPLACPPGFRLPPPQRQSAQSRNQQPYVTLTVAPFGHRQVTEKQYQNGPRLNSAAAARHPQPVPQQGHEAREESQIHGPQHDRRVAKDSSNRRMDPDHTRQIRFVNVTVQHTAA